MLPRLMIALCTNAMFLNAAITGESKTDDSKKIQGTWRLVSWDGPGGKLPDGALQHARLTISSTQISALIAGEEAVFTYKLKPLQNPKEIDWIEDVLMEVKGKKVKTTQKVLGIYDLSGDILKLCIGENYRGKDAKTIRPMDFRAGKDSVLIILKRDK